MPERYTIADAKNNLPGLVHAVESGQPVELTRHGKPVAVLVSIKDFRRMSRKRVSYWGALNSWRKRLQKEGISLSGDEFEGLRDESGGREVDL